MVSERSVCSLSLCVPECRKLLKRERKTMLLASSWITDALMIVVAVIAGGVFGVILKKFLKK